MMSSMCRTDPGPVCTNRFKESPKSIPQVFQHILHHTAALHPIVLHLKLGFQVSTQQLIIAHYAE